MWPLSSVIHGATPGFVSGATSRHHESPPEDCTGILVASSAPGMPARQGPARLKASTPSRRRGHNQRPARATTRDRHAERRARTNCHPRRDRDPGLPPHGTRGLTFSVQGAAIRLDGTHHLAPSTPSLHGEVLLKASPSHTLTGFKRWLVKPFDTLFRKNSAGTRLAIYIKGTQDHPKIGLELGKTLRGR